MRKFLITLLFLFGVSAPVFAQSPQITTQMTTATTATGTGVAVPTTGYHMITWTLAGPAPTACTVAVDSSADNSSWTAGGAIPGQTCTSGGQSAVVNLSTGYIRINVTAFTGSGTLKVFYLGTSGIAGSSTTSTVSIGAPVGTCAQGALDTDKNTGNLYACNNGTWVLAGGGAGIVYSAGGGTAQAQTMTPSPASSSLNTGTTLYCWLPTAANTGAAPTLAISGLTAKPITKYGTVALVANDITTAGIACVIYDGTEFQLQVPLAGGVYSSSLSLGSGASAAGATATGGFACVEAASTGWTPTAGQDYQRCDSTAHAFVCSNNGAAESACSPAPSYPVTVGGTVTSGGIPYFSSTTIESSSALLAAGALVAGGGAGVAPGTGNADFTLPLASHTLTAGAAGLVNLSAETSGDGLRIPVTTTEPSLAGGLIVNNTNKNLEMYDGAGHAFLALAAGYGQQSTSCTNQVISAIFSANGTGPTCHTVVGADMGNTLTLTGAHSSATYLTATNCSSSASPAVCGSAAAGSVAVPTGVTPTLVVNTTAVTANSQILFTPDESLGTKLSVTCNSTIAQVAIEPIVTARTAATSFTIQYNTTITVNPICLSYLIVN